MSKFCRECGAALEEDALFCSACGCKLESTEISTPRTETQGGGVPLGLSYLFSVLGTIIAAAVRASQQAEYWYYVNIVDNEKVLGIAREDKPKYMLIPLMSFILSTLMVLLNRSKRTQSKLTAFFINCIFVLASVLVIWYEVRRDYW